MSAAACMLCRSVESREIQRGARYAPEAVIRACLSCDLVFLSPRPDEAELAAYYAGEYRAEYDGSVSPADTYQKAVVEAPARAERVRPLLTEGARVLDVGCGSGAFLEAVRPYAGEVLGVEPGTAHREWARECLGINIVGDLADIGSQRFELIGLFHTLEHLPDPVAFLGRLSGYLAPGGAIAIEVPNVDDALVALYQIGPFLRSYFQRAHLYYFSAETLTATVAAAGGAAHVEGIQRYDLSNHLRWMLTGEPGGQGYYRSVLGSDVHEAYARAVIKAGHADTLWCVARFPGLER